VIQTVASHLAGGLAAVCRIADNHIMALRILGLDPGLQTTGYAVVEDGGDRLDFIQAGEIITDRSDPLEDRLRFIFAKLGEVVSEFKPGVATVEDLYSQYRHPRTAILMGHARGVLFVVLSNHGIPVFSYAPARIKKALTGNGRASKDQVHRAIEELLSLRGVDSDHVTDALAAAVCYIREAHVPPTPRRKRGDSRLRAKR